MKRTLIAVLSSLAFALLSLQFAIAEETKQDCNKLNEQISITVRFNGVLDSAQKALNKINELENNFLSLARKLGVLEVKPSGQNFNLNSSQGGGTGYQYSGSMVYKVAPYNTAIRLVEELTKSGHQVNLRVNRNPYPSCY
jgi:hypothetical protein